MLSACVHFSFSLHSFATARQLTVGNCMSTRRLIILVPGARAKRSHLARDNAQEDAYADDSMPECEFISWSLRTRGMGAGDEGV